MFERAPVRVDRRRTGQDRSVADRLQSAPATRLARPPDADRVRCPMSGHDHRRSGAGLVTNCLVLGPTSRARGVYFCGVYLTGKLTGARDPPRGHRRAVAATIYARTHSVRTPWMMQMRHGAPGQVKLPVPAVDGLVVSGLRRTRVDKTCQRRHIGDRHLTFHLRQRTSGRSLVIPADGIFLDTAIFRNVKNGDKNGADSEIRVVIRERLTGRSWLTFVAHRHEIP